MSTRVYTLNFLGAGMLPLPQGRFFMVKSASSALDISAKRRDGQPMEFSNVGAGLQFNGLETQRWYSLEVTSGVAQVVEIVISDEASVTFANAVSVQGTTQTIEQPASSMSAVTYNVADASNQDIAANPARRRVTFCAPSGNTGSVFLRDTAGALAIGIELQPGTFVTLANVGAIRIRNSSGATQTVNTLEET